MSARTGVAPARRMALTEAKKLNGVVMTASPGPMPAAARASQRASVPEEQPMAWATPSCAAAALEFSYRLTEDKLLRLQYMPESSQQFLMERLVLALQVEHRHGLICGSRMHRRVGGLLHLTMVSAAGTEHLIVRSDQNL